MIRIVQVFGQPCLYIAVWLLAVAVIIPAHAASLGDIPVYEEFTAGLRAIAAQDPDPKIRNPDTLAAKFLSPTFWFWSSLDQDYAKSKQFIRFYRASGYYTANACTKHIDAVLENVSQAGFDQVVIIGAGLDSRAYRFGRQMPKLRFFEVDLPAAARRKQELVAAALGKAPTTVSYIPVDYRNGQMDQALETAGYDSRKTTLFIWENVTPYMEPLAVDSILRFISTRSPAGSQVVFDYIPDDIVRKEYARHRRARFHAERMAAHGHPWKFGLARKKAARFVADRGFAVVENLGAKELAQRYLMRSDGSIDGKVTPYFSIMQAEVK